MPVEPHALRAQKEPKQSVQERMLPAAADSKGVKLDGFISYVEDKKNQTRIDKRIEKVHLKIARLLKTQYWKDFILTALCC